MRQSQIERLVDLLSAFSIDPAWIKDQLAEKGLLVGDGSKQGCAQLPTLLASVQAVVEAQEQLAQRSLLEVKPEEPILASESAQDEGAADYDLQAHSEGEPILLLEQLAFSTNNNAGAEPELTCSDDEFYPPMNQPSPSMEKGELLDEHFAAMEGELTLALMEAVPVTTGPIAASPEPQTKTKFELEFELALEQLERLGDDLDLPLAA